MNYGEGISGAVLWWGMRSGDPGQSPARAWVRVRSSVVLCYLLSYLIEQTLSVNHHITSTSARPSDVQGSLLPRVGSAKTKH